MADMFQRERGCLTAEGAAYLDACAARDREHAAKAAADKAAWSQFAGTTFQKPWLNGQGVENLTFSARAGEVEDKYGNFLAILPEGWQGKAINEVIAAAIAAVNAAMEEYHD